MKDRRRKSPKRKMNAMNRGMNAMKGRVNARKMRVMTSQAVRREGEPSRTAGLVCIKLF